MLIDNYDIGSSFLIIQYEDIISLIGYNIAKAMRDTNDKLKGMSDDDILLAYFNREKYDISEWLLNEFGIEFSKEQYMQSPRSLRPNMIYAFRMIEYLRKEKYGNIMIYSNEYSEVIETIFSKYKEDIKYEYGDIIPILQSHPNCTYVTSNEENILKCKKVGVPFALTIVDDFMYMKDVVAMNVEIGLRKLNVYAMYSSIVGAGIQK